MINFRGKDFPEVLWSAKGTTQLKRLLCDHFFFQLLGTKSEGGGKTRIGYCCSLSLWLPPVPERTEAGIGMDTRISISNFVCGV